MSYGKIKLCCLSLLITSIGFSQNMTPELLWKLGRVSGVGISKDGKNVVYNVTTPDVNENKFTTTIYYIPISDGEAKVLNNPDSLLANKAISPDGKYSIAYREEKIKKVTGVDNYPSLTKSNVYILESLNYRHWDTWEDGKFNHIKLIKGTDTIDIMPGEPYNAGAFAWSTDSKQIIYSCKKKYGTAYTISTNSDLYVYDIETGKTSNLTEGIMGYDNAPVFNKQGQLAWLSMKRDGFESDKQDIIVWDGITKMNLTQYRDDIQVNNCQWSEDGRKLFFTSATNGTEQLYEISYPGRTKMMPIVRQITKGDFDVDAVVGQSGNTLVVIRTDMNHAAELYTVDLSTGNMQQLTHTNDAIYAGINMCKTERRFVKTTDGKNMLVWVIYPPGFDKTKKYPAILYCQGGPQVSLTQYYSFRWNFQLMASQGYIVIAPNRRGMPGHGVKWNEEVSKDWGGQVIRDYISATDAICKEPFIDKKRVAAAGASFGGFSVFYLAGMHNNRFRSFIAHDGVFDFRSMYGTTDEMFFETWEKGGAYWEKNNAVAQRSFSQSPSDMVGKWNTPILIYQGGKDFRIGIEQGQQAFQAAQLRGIKSKFVFFPEENHWVLNPQNALIWQHEFYNWLEETMK